MIYYILGGTLLICICIDKYANQTTREKEFTTAIGFFALTGLLVLLFFGGA